MDAVKGCAVTLDAICGNYGSVKEYDLRQRRRAIRGSKQSVRDVVELQGLRVQHVLLHRQMSNLHCGNVRNELGLLSLGSLCFYVPSFPDIL